MPFCHYKTANSCCDSSICVLSPLDTPCFWHKNLCGKLSHLYKCHCVNVIYELLQEAYWSVKDLLCRYSLYMLSVKPFHGYTGCLVALYWSPRLNCYIIVVEILNNIVSIWLEKEEVIAEILPWQSLQDHPSVRHNMYRVWTLIFRILSSFHMEG